MGYSEPLELLIGGTWRAGSEGKTEPVYNPATGAVIGEVPHASSSDLGEALAASDTGSEIWRATVPAARQEVMSRAADFLTDRIDRIARLMTLEQGKPVAEARIELQAVIGAPRWFGEEGKRLYGRQVAARMPNPR